MNQSALHDSIASFGKTDEVIVIPEKSDLTNKQKLKKMFYSFLFGFRIRFLFNPSLALINFILEKNNLMVGNHSIDVREFLFYNFDGVLKLLGFLDKIKFESLKVFKEKIISKEITLKDFDTKFNEVFSDLQRNIILRSLSFNEFSPENMIHPKATFENEPANLNSYDRLQLVIDEQICLFNIKENESKSLEEIKKLKMIDFIALFFEVIISKWEIICYIVLITYYFFNNGISCWILFFYMFVFLIFEEKKAKMFAWKMCFIYFVVIAALKLFLYLQMVTPKNEVPTTDDNDNVSSIEVFPFEFF